MQTLFAPGAAFSQFPPLLQPIMSDNSKEQHSSWRDSPPSSHRAAGSVILPEKPRKICIFGDVLITQRDKLGKDCLWLMKLSGQAGL